MKYVISSLMRQHEILKFEFDIKFILYLIEYINILQNINLISYLPLSY